MEGRGLMATGERRWKAAVENGQERQVDRVRWGRWRKAERKKNTTNVCLPYVGQHVIFN